MYLMRLALSTWRSAETLQQCRPAVVAEQGRIFMPMPRLGWLTSGSTTCVTPGPVGMSSLEHHFLCSRNWKTLERVKKYAHLAPEHLAHHTNAVMFWSEQAHSGKKEAPKHAA